MRAIGRTVLFSFLILLFAEQGDAQYLNNGNVEYLVQSSIWSLLVNSNWEANNYSKILKRHFPSYPVTYILPVLNEMAVSEDKGVPLNDLKIEADLSKAAVISDSLLENNPNAENYFFNGLTEGVLAYFKYKEGDYLSAFFSGLRALEKFESCLREDSLFAAAQVAIGTYKYWLSEKTRSVHWLPLVRDERQLGLRLLKLGLRKNNILYHFGLESLIWIYIHQKHFELAKEIAQKAVKKYPYSRYFIYALAHSYNGIDKTEANKYFNELIESRKHDGCLSNYWEAILLHKIAMNDAALKKYAEAKKICEEILSLNYTEYEKEKLGNRLDRVEQLKERMVKKLKIN